MIRQIWFDLDGTIADLYGVNGWLQMIINGDATPYEIAKPLLKLNILARMLNKLQGAGYEIGVISWLAKNSTQDYDIKVTQAKQEWLKQHLSSVKFDHIDIVPYGTPKQIGRDGILFDDEPQNRENWCGIAYDVENILGVLKSL